MLNPTMDRYSITIARIIEASKTYSHSEMYELLQGYAIQERRKANTEGYEEGYRAGKSHGYAIGYNSPQAAPEGESADTSKNVTDKAQLSPSVAF